MIKKILYAFFMILVSGMANANIHIVGKKVEEIVLEHIDAEHRKAALKEYNVQLKATGNYTMSATGLDKVCAAAGWDTTKPEGKTKCDNFVKALVLESDYKYYEVCGDDQGKTGGDEHCVEDVFYAGLNADIKMTMLQAEGLCKEYARVKYNDDIECSNETRGKINDYVKCTSKLKPIYYEFKFDSVTGAKLDSVLHNSVKYSVCKIHETNLGFPKSTAIDHNAKPVDYNSFCVTSDKTKCSQINDSMGKFAYKSFIKDNKCVIDQKYDITKDTLRTAFGINNYNFDKGYQLSAYNDLREKLCEYIKKNANTTINTCECDYNFTRVVDNSGLVPEADDVLTCHANNQPIDFIFDDLNENVKKLSQGNMEAFNCTVLGGEYQGKTCFTPDASLCAEIAKATKKECPECAEAYFDTEKNACVLPNATKANEHQKNVNIGLIVGGTVVGAAVIIYTGGTGFAAVAVALETIGGAMEYGAQVHIDGIADEFFMKANNCDNATCAEELLKEYFQYISRMVNDLQSGEKVGVDSKMATLIEMLPDDSQFLTDIVAACYENNGDNFDISKCDDGKWNGNQIIRAVGIGLQFTSVFASVGKFILTKAGMVEKIANTTPKLTAALSKKIPGVKARIAQKIAEGGKVLRSDGKVINMSKAAKSANSELMGKLKGWKVPKIERVKDNGAVMVYKFTERNSGKVYYLKYTDELDEIKRTKRAYEIAGNQSDIVHIVKVVEDDQAVLKDFTMKYDLPQLEGHHWFVMEELPSSKGALSIVNDGLFNSVLGGKPITIAEQEEVLRVVKKLNDNGLQHGDLWSNMFIMREPNGKLRVDIIDFEPWSAEAAMKPQDIQDVKNMFKKLAENGCAEIKTTKATSVAKTDDVAKGTAKTTNVSYKEGKQLVKAGKWADATVLDPTFDIKVTPLELGGKKYYLKAGNTETLIQNEISRTKQAHELLKHNKIVTSVGVVEDDQTVLKAFMDAHPDITLPRTPDTQYFIMDATHANTVEELSDAEILGYLRNKPITIEEQNTILSELQNMNNNGLIHNDIWHNFAIYRDSGGKLHMELMDFGDFTAEDKLFRSNDDVLEIKKLFSKWSDRGLVEKGVAKKSR